MSRNTKKTRTEGKPGRRVVGGLFAAGFAFFFIKGLVWLAIGGLALVGILR